MANAVLSPKQLAELLASLDQAQRSVQAVREQLIRAMAARHQAAGDQRPATGGQRSAHAGTRRSRR